MLRPVGRLLSVSVLHYDAAVRPAASFEKNLGDAEVSPQELKLAKTLIDVSIDKHAQMDEFRNLYNERLEVLVQSKIAGHEVARPPVDESGPPVINLMDALKASLAKKAPRRPGSGKVTPESRIKRPTKRRKLG